MKLDKREVRMTFLHSVGGALVELFRSKQRRRCRTSAGPYLLSSLLRATPPPVVYNSCHTTPPPPLHFFIVQSHQRFEARILA